MIYYIHFEITVIFAIWLALMLRFILELHQARDFSKAQFGDGESRNDCQ